MRAELRFLIAQFLVLLLSIAPVSAARQIVDLHKLDAYFALFASDANVPWQPATVRLDTYSGAPVDLAVYQVDPGDVLTAGTNARPRAIDTRGRKAVAAWRFTPPGAYQFESSVVRVPLGSREGFFVIEARRGNVGEQVWINRTRVALLTKELPGGIILYGADSGTGKAIPHMRVQLLVNGRFDTRETDAHGILRYNRMPWPIFALAQSGGSFAFVSLLPQAPVPSTVVGVRTDSAVVHAGDAVRVAGFARTRAGSQMRPAHGTVVVTMRDGGRLVGEQRVELDGAGAFSAEIPVPATAPAGDYALIAQADGGVGSVSVRVDANAEGISLRARSGCAASCEANAPVPVRIVSSRGGVPVHVRVVRTPHVFLPGYAPQTTPWGTTVWMNADVTTGADGIATLDIPQPADRLASTYGVHVDSGGATADTRIVVPTSPATIQLQLDRMQQTLGTPVRFNVRAADIASGRPIANAPVTVTMKHGVSVDKQTVTLDANGFARGTFNSPQNGTNLVMASVTVDGATATDASEVQLTAQPATDLDENGSGAVRLSFDRDVYHAGDTVRVDADLDGGRGDALLTWENADGPQAVVVPANNGRASATFKAGDTIGDVRIGAAFVRDGAIEWTTASVPLDAPGRAEDVPMEIRTDGGYARVNLKGALPGPGTVVVRVTRGAPSGAAVFDTAPSLLSVALASTLNSAPSGTTWHPWVDSTGNHPQVLGFVRKQVPPADLSVSDASTEAMSWQVMRDDADPISVQLPQARGRYTVSVLKMSDDGRVVASSSNVEVP